MPYSNSNLVMTPAAATSTSTSTSTSTYAPNSTTTAGGNGSANTNGGNGHGHGHEEHLVSALHAALHSLSGPAPGHTPSPAGELVSSSFTTSTSPTTIYPSHPVRSEGHSPREKPHAPTLDISVASDQLSLRGTGVDVEPTLLSGNVVLHLSEPTSIKQIVLVFRGKARVPSNPHDPHVLNSSPNQYVVCSHEWTFLEGEKKHSHTLKAGRHLFPFELRLGGALPSSLATYVNGGASISYKLRATAFRPGLAANLTSSIPITLLRTFAPESLEYQQTLEIENTWPEKVMYSLMIPHKAWAAGDELTALLKFAPLAKGVRVLSVTTHLCETIRTLARGAGHLEKTRNVVTRKHDIINGQAVSVDEQQRKKLHSALQRTLGEQGGQQTVLSNLSGPSGLSSGLATAFVSGTSTPILEGMVLARSGSRESAGSAGSGGVGPAANAQAEDEMDDSDSEITTSINIPLPPSLTPSHSLDPIIVSYRIRWSVLLANLDGHTSELRCSLPIHILDYSLLEEARAATRATRRLLFGGGDAAQVEEEDIQLPSYPSHVRDRVAVDIPFSSDPAFTTSGTTTPQHEGAPHPLSDFPGFTQDGVGVATSPFAFTAPLSRVQTQTQAQNVPVSSGNRNVQFSTGGTPPDSSSSESSRPNTRPNSRHERDAPMGSNGGGGGGGGGWGPFSRARLHSRANSRANSRAPSPERDHTHTHPTLPLPSLPSLPSAQTIPPTPPGISRADETHIHTSNAASRQTHGLFSVAMKPLARVSSFAAPWHVNSHTAALAQHFQNTYAHAQANAHGRAHAQRNVGMTGSASVGDLRALGSLTTPGTPSDVFTGTNGGGGGSMSTSVVPDYFTASHGAGSVVPPLESLRGLPSYEDSEAQVHGSASGSATSGSATSGSESGGSLVEGQRSFSDTDLVSLFVRPRGEVQRVR